jgi:hypothetical protein
MMDERRAIVYERLLTFASFSRKDNAYFFLCASSEDSIVEAGRIGYHRSSVVFRMCDFVGTEDKVVDVE